MTPRKNLILSALALGAAAGLALPAVASADCVRRNDAGANGAVIGALAGAAIGNSASGRHSKGTGTVAGALVGAAVGSSIARGNTHCGAGYYDDGYYDSRYDSRYDQGYDDGYYDSRPRTRVYVQPRTVYVEPRPYPYYREYYYAPPRYQHHRRHW